MDTLLSIRYDIGLGVQLQKIDKLGSARGKVRREQWKTIEYFFPLGKTTLNLMGREKQPYVSFGNFVISTSMFYGSAGVPAISSYSLHGLFTQLINSIG